LLVRSVEGLYGDEQEYQRSQRTVNSHLPFGFTVTAENITDPASVTQWSSPYPALYHFGTQNEIVGSIPFGGPFSIVKTDQVIEWGPFLRQILINFTLPEDNADFFASGSETKTGGDITDCIFTLSMGTALLPNGSGLVWQNSDGTFNMTLLNATVIFFAPSTGPDGFDLPLDINDPTMVRWFPNGTFGASADPTDIVGLATYQVTFEFWLQENRSPAATTAHMTTGTGVKGGTTGSSVKGTTAHHSTTTNSTDATTAVNSNTHGFNSSTTAEVASDHTSTAPRTVDYFRQLLLVLLSVVLAVVIV